MKAFSIISLGVLTSLAMASAAIAAPKPETTAEPQRYVKVTEQPIEEVRTARPQMFVK
ncbi:MAG: hypothetical protein AAGA46_07180 [Cyanobacteria bacterium P01_F01_bin.13]